MAQKVLRIVRGAGSTLVHNVDDRTTTGYAQFQPGEPLVRGIVTSQYVVPPANGSPVVGSDEWVGIARKASTETTAANGVVEAYSFIPGLTVVRGLVTTTTNADADSEILALIGKFRSLDRASLTGYNGDFTIDEDDTTLGGEPNKCPIKIIDGNSIKNTLDVLVMANATTSGCLVGQTMD